MKNKCLFCASPFVTIVKERREIAFRSNGRCVARQILYCECLSCKNDFQLKIEKTIDRF